MLDVASVRDLVEVPRAKPKSSKPDPDIVLAALAQANADAAEARMIGDSPYDIEAAHRAGVRIVALRCGGWDSRCLAQAFAVYTDPAEVLEHLLQWTGLSLNAAQKGII